MKTSLDNVIKFIESSTLEEAKEIKKLSHKRYYLLRGDVKARELVQFNSWDMRMATAMEKAILATFPKFKKKNDDELTKWANEFRKLRTLDGHDEQTIIDVLSWALKDPFWKRIILSAGKFRQKFEQLMAGQAGGGGLI